MLDLGLYSNGNIGPFHTSLAQLLQSLVHADRADRTDNRREEFSGFYFPGICVKHMCSFSTFFSLPIPQGHILPRNGAGSSSSDENIKTLCIGC